MSDTESSNDASDEESITICEAKGTMDINSFDLIKYSMTGFHMDLRGTLRPGFEIGWVTSLKVLLYYGDILVGEGSLPNKLIIPNCNNRVKLGVCQGMDVKIDIKSMMGLKYFFEAFMPKVDANYKFNSQKRVTAGLKVSPGGHQLTMSIDLATTPRVECTVKSLTLSGTKLKIILATRNPGPFAQTFIGHAQFVLEQDRRILGYLEDREFGLDLDQSQHKIKGHIISGVSGKAILKGNMIHESDGDSSWLCYALRLFEVEINLDEILVKTKSKDV